MFLPASAFLREGITFWPLREVIRQASGGHDSPDKIKALLDGQADAAEVAARLSLALGPGNQGRLDAAEIFLGGPPTGSRHWHGPGHCWSFSRICTGPNRPSSTWWNPWPSSQGDRRCPGLRRPPGTARTASCLGGGNRKGSLHRTHATRCRLSRGAPGFTDRGPGHSAVHSGPPA